MVALHSLWLQCATLMLLDSAKDPLLFSVIHFKHPKQPHTAQVNVNTVNLFPFAAQLHNKHYCISDISENSKNRKLKHVSTSFWNVSCTQKKSFNDIEFAKIITGICCLFLFQI